MFKNYMNDKHVPRKRLRMQNIMEHKCRMERFCPFPCLPFLWSRDRLLLLGLPKWNCSSPRLPRGFHRIWERVSINSRTLLCSDPHYQCMHCQSERQVIFMSWKIFVYQDKYNLNQIKLTAIPFKLMTVWFVILLFCSIRSASWGT